MLRVNLLPPYIYEKQTKVRWAGLWLAVLAVVIGLFIAWTGHVAANAAAAQKDDDDSKQLLSQYQDYDTKINAEKQRVADTQAKETFVADAQKYNDAWPALYAMMRDLTSDRVVLNSMSLAQDRQTLQFAGFSPTELDIVRWWMLLRNNSGKFERVEFSLPQHAWNGAPYAGGQNQFGGGMGMLGGGGFPGMMRPGMGGGPPMSGMMGGSMGNKFSMMMAGSGGGGAGRFGGAGGGGSLRNATATPTELEGKQGLAFSAIAVLKDAFAGGMPTPMWPAAATGGGMAGMGGMMPGMMGGGPPMMGAMRPGMGGVAAPGGGAAAGSTKD